MNLLVTGGAGFIGSHFVLRHIDQYPDDQVVVLDKLTYAGDRSFLVPIEDRMTFIQGDIADREVVQQLVDAHTIDTIINFAAESHNDNAIADSSPFLSANILGVHSLLEICKDDPSVRLLHISTDEVYGDLRDDDPPYTTEDRLQPNMPYAATKAAAEMLVMAWAHTHGVKACITRCTNNYGPHQHDEKFLPTAIRHALKDEKIPLYGDGKNKRDWLYVTDHTDAVELLLQSGEAFDEEMHDARIFNISADDERENLFVAKTVLDLLGKSNDLIEFVPDRPGHDWRYAIDSSDVRKFGWEPRVSFEEGISNTIDWYKDRFSP